MTRHVKYTLNWCYLDINTASDTVSRYSNKNSKNNKEGFCALSCYCTKQVLCNKHFLKKAFRTMLALNSFDIVSLSTLCKLFWTSIVSVAKYQDWMMIVIFNTNPRYIKKILVKNAFLNDSEYSYPTSNCLHFVVFCYKLKKKRQSFSTCIQSYCVSNCVGF